VRLTPEKPAALWYVLHTIPPPPSRGSTIIYEEVCDGSAPVPGSAGVAAGHDAGSA